MTAPPPQHHGNVGTPKGPGLQTEFDIVNPRHFRPTKPQRGVASQSRAQGAFLRNATVDLVEFYGKCSSSFGYSDNLAPRRVLTKLCKGVHNHGYDNAEHDYICRVGTKMVNPDGQTYEIFDRLGHGTFGQVLKCLPSGSRTPVALKIIKDKPAYFHQALVEVHILQKLNTQYDPEDARRIVRMLDYFVYRKHLCIVFELLSVNLYEVLKQNGFRGVSFSLIRALTEQLLKAMCCLREASVIHCDLKPENILLSNLKTAKIKLIDFGSACFESNTMYSYVQSRFYRSPEVLLGLPYTSAIDMWSLGCICAELFLGLPSFPGQTEYDQVCRIVEVLGLPPTHMLDASQNVRRYFRRVEEPQDQAVGGDGVASTAGVPATAATARSMQIVGGTGSSVDPSGAEPATVPMVPPGHGETAGAPAGHSSSTACAVAVSEDPGERTGPPPGESSDGSRPRAVTQAWSSSAPAGAAAAGQSHSAAPGSAGVPAPGSQGQGVAAEERATDESSPEPPRAFAEGGSHRQSGEEEQQPRSDSLRRNESLLDLLKRRMGITADEPEPSEAAAQAALDDDGQKVAADSCLVLSDATQSVGSTRSTTAAEGSEGAAGPGYGQRRRVPSGGGDEAPPGSSGGGRDGSSDGGQQLRYQSGSSDGGLGQHGGYSHAQISPPSLMPPAPRSQVRRPKKRFWRLKTRQEFERDECKKEPNHKKYSFDFKSLEQMVDRYPTKANLTQDQLKHEMERRLCFLSFLQGVLQWNPEHRWTPKQATVHFFIANSPYDPDWQPPHDDTAAPARPPVGLEVPRFPAENLAQTYMAPGVVSAAGGGSARAWQESIVQQPPSNRANSAPTTARGGKGSGGKEQLQQPLQPPPPPAAQQQMLAPPPPAPGFSPAASSAASAGPPVGQQPPGHQQRRARMEQGGASGSAAPYGTAEGQQKQRTHQAKAMPDNFSRVRSFLREMGGVLPDEMAAESYRPPIEIVSEDFFRAAAPMHQQARPLDSEQAGAAGTSGQSTVVRNSGAWSTSAATSFYSSASSAGSTPSGGRGRRVSPRPSKRGQLQQADPKVASLGRHHHLSGTTVTPASSPQGSAASTGVNAHAGTPAHGAASTGGYPAGSAPPQGRAVGSRDGGSRGSSPWHLPSPNSELSMDSERMNSSEACGSDSCGETLHYVGTCSPNAQCNFEGCAFDEQSQSDTPGAHYPRSNQLSDSDSNTPRSHDAGQGNKETDQDRGAKDSQHALWENVRSEVARVGLTGDRIPRRLDSTLSPGSAGTGNFRQAVGMEERGPVIPFSSSSRNRAKRPTGVPVVQGAWGRPGGSSGSGSGSSDPRGRTADAASRTT